MKRLLLFIYLLIVNIECKFIINKLTIPTVSDQLIQQYFKEWMTNNNVLYDNDQFLYRFEIFKNNFHYIREWNSGDSPTILGLNAFADLENEEFRSLYNMLPVANLDDYYQNHPQNIDVKKQFSFKSAHGYDLGPRPMSFDWRKKNAVGPIQNQGRCSSSWAFSAAGAMTSTHKIDSDPLGVDITILSTQQLLDCAGPYGTEGCLYGTPDQAFDYAINSQGMVSSLGYPYEGYNTTCRSYETDVVAQFDSFELLTSGNEEDLEIMLLKAPVSVVIDGGLLSFQLYQGGVYYEQACNNLTLTASLLVVGYSYATLSPSGILSGSTGLTGNRISLSALGGLSSSADSTSTGYTASISSSWATSSDSASSAWGQLTSSSGYSGQLNQNQNQNQNNIEQDKMGGNGQSSKEQMNTIPYWTLVNSWGTNWGENGVLYLIKDYHNACGIASLATTINSIPNNSKDSSNSAAPSE
ncbi:cysteine protease 4 [Tieghemostelium lacteum]|uniref:Cysteine protease 4 n=1 Tax=Tieghemostelium lacteum TaxID=361077 RepID=A0A152A9V7_TIELA|nr:cysteine protease 4 [Tieghemostelium lacteum]|eukprot:KYR02911.1 cysteine protease 4 [Tieghemostelium lacteum]